MSNPDGQSEPSMEEILASIRRIISEDDKEQKGTASPEGGKTSNVGAAESAPADTAEEDVLDLTEKAEPAGSLHPVEEEDAGKTASDSPPSDPFEQSSEEEQEMAPDPFEALQEAGFTEEISPVAEEEAPQPEDSAFDDIMQDETSTESGQQADETMREAEETQKGEDSGIEEGLVSSATAAATVAALSEASRDVRSQARAAEDLPIQSDKTLEGLVREAVKPLLKEWLDQNLSPLVERVVREEVRRLVRRAEDD